MKHVDFYIHVHKSYPEFEVDVELSLAHGEFFSLLGPSGCGKTTFLRLIAGLEKNEFGSILLNGEDVSILPPTRRKIGMVFQEYALFPHLNVTENVSYGLKSQKRSRSEIKSKVERMLILFELEALQTRNVQQLSGGEKQRVALARSLVTEPHILLLDEPFSALDYNLRAKLRQDLRLYQKKLGFTTIFVTHHQEEALILSDRLAVMQNGRLLQLGTPHQIYEQPACRFVSEFIGEANFILGIRQPATATFKLSCSNEAFPLSMLPEYGCDSERFYLMIRPEDIQINDSGADPLIGVTGRVTRIDYMGYMCRIEVSTDPTKELFIVFLPKSLRPPAEGADVSLSFPQSALHSIPD